MHWESFTSFLPGNGSAWLLERLISILVEAVLFPKGGFGLLVLISKVGLPARAEADMPPPEAADEGFGILVVMSP